MPTKISAKQLREIEKYDYLRSECFQKGGNRPYIPRPLTKFEMFLIEKIFGIHLSDKTMSYADISTETLEKIIQNSPKDRPSLFSRLKQIKIIIDKTDKNYSQDDIKKFLDNLWYLDYLFKRAKLRIRMAKESKYSIFSIFNKTGYYENYKEDLKMDLEETYKIDLDDYLEEDDLEKCNFDKRDIMFVCTTAFRSIPQNAQKELDNRKKFLDKKKRRDEDDFIRMSKKMKEFYEAGDFKKGDKLLSYYTYQGDRFLNNVARHNVSLEELNVHDRKDLISSEVYGKLCDHHIISEDLFLKTIIELSEVRNRINGESKSVEDILREQGSKEKFLYRGLGLEGFIKTIRVRWGEKAETETTTRSNPNDWFTDKGDLKKKYIDEICTCLKEKISIDTAILSTSLDKSQAIEFAERAGTGVLLKIDVTRSIKGVDMQSCSKVSDEKEIILSPRTKLKIESVTKPDEIRKFFIVECKPV